jgi:hypothetical protein
VETRVLLTLATVPRTAGRYMWVHRSFDVTVRDVAAHAALRVCPPLSVPSNRMQLVVLI